MIIDAHAHIYPDKIARRASDSISKFYDIGMCEEGTVSRLIALGDEYGIDKFLVHSVATTPEQTGIITNYISSVVNDYPDRMIGFTSLHPDSDDIADEVDRAIDLGLKGIKLHPDFQEFNIDSDAAFRIYEVIEGRLPVLIHTGDYRTQFSKPERILNVIKRFPRLTVIAAHFGGWSEWDSAAAALAGTGVYVDTSSSQYALPPGKIRELLDRYGENYCIFGSDYPMWNVKHELDMLMPLFRSDEEKEKVLHDNIEKLVC